VSVAAQHTVAQQFYAYHVDACVAVVANYNSSIIEEEHISAHRYCKMQNRTGFRSCICTSAVLFIL